MGIFPPFKPAIKKAHFRPGGTVHAFNPSTMVGRGRLIFMFSANQDYTVRPCLKKERRKASLEIYRACIIVYFKGRQSILIILL